MHSRIFQGAAAKQKLQNSSNPTARITPVSSSLLAARPIKDPRLLRQQASAVNSNSTFENKPVPPPPVDSKVIVNSNKTSVRDVRNEPRLVTNKDIPISQGKARALPRIPIKSNTKNTDSHKIPKSSRSSKSSLFDGPSKSSASLLDPPAKKGDKSSDSSKSRSPSKSPNKHKKKDSVSKSDVKRSDKSKQPKPERDSKSSKSDNAAFKDLKSQVKNRNYIRRNHASSMSPEPNRDVDLRLGVPPEKIPRLQGESDKSKNSEFAGMMGCFLFWICYCFSLFFHTTRFSFSNNLSSISYYFHLLLSNCFRSFILLNNMKIPILITI